MNIFVNKFNWITGCGNRKRNNEEILGYDANEYEPHHKQFRHLNIFSTRREYSVTIDDEKIIDNVYSFYTICCYKDLVVLNVLNSYKLLFVNDKHGTDITGLLKYLDNTDNRLKVINYIRGNTIVGNISNAVNDLDTFASMKVISRKL